MHKVQSQTSQNSKAKGNEFLIPLELGPQSLEIQIIRSEENKYEGNGKIVPVQTSPLALHQFFPTMESPSKIGASSSRLTPNWFVLELAIVKLGH